METVTTLEHWRAWRRDGCNVLPFLRCVPLAPGEDRPAEWCGAWRAAHPYAILLESGKDGRYTYLGLRPSAVLRGKGNEAAAEEWKGRVNDFGAIPVNPNEPFGSPVQPVQSGQPTLSDQFGSPAQPVQSGKSAKSDQLGFPGQSGRPAQPVQTGQPMQPGSPEHPGQPGRSDDSNPPVLRFNGNPLDVVRAWMKGRLAPRLTDAPPFLTDVPPFTGGIAGMWSYDVARSIERLPELAADDLGLPDYMFLRLDELWIIDHEAGRLWLSCHVVVPTEASDEELAGLYRQAERQTGCMLDVWRAITAAANTPEARRRLAARRSATEADRLEIDIESLDLIRPFSKASYMKAVEKIRQYIARGDVFQVNLSQRMSKRSSADAGDLYEWLRLFNPSPYMGCLYGPDFRLVSASPELLVAKRGKRLSTRPIAGTRRRGRTAEEDRHLADELLTNVKERAEHVMLVDLERNDLGRVSNYGTVRVTELMTIERYSHVMHLVSLVEGELADGKDAFDVIGALFPGGTITGAPKVRTMEILEELEPVRRGPYYGSLGWIDYNGDMEFNILIRTLVVKDGFVHVQAGGGVVIDSDPEREYFESLNKAKALWKAVQYAENEAVTPQAWEGVQP
jgi:para-aminobenzoate synthetase component 1